MQPLHSQQLSEFVHVHVLTCNHKLQDALCLYWLLALFFEFELDLVLNYYFSWLGTHLLYLLLKLFHIQLTWVADQTHKEV